MYNIEKKKDVLDVTILFEIEELKKDVSKCAHYALRDSIESCIDDLEKSIYNPSFYLSLVENAISKASLWLKREINDSNIRIEVMEKNDITTLFMMNEESWNERLSNSLRFYQRIDKIKETIKATINVINE